MNLVLFEIQGTTWGVRLKWVDHVITSKDIGFLPNAHPLVAGLINVRGNIVPVIRGAELLLSHNSINKSPRILLLSYKGDSLGLMVDSIMKVVQGVFLGDDESIEPGPYVQGVCTIDTGIKINVLDIHGLFQSLAATGKTIPETVPENHLVKEAT